MMMSTNRGTFAKAVAVIVAAFIAGLVLGVTADRTILKKPRVTTHFVGDMSEVLNELQLTPSQRAAAEDIISRQTPRATAVMMRTAENLREVSDSVDAALRLILTPDQRARLDSLRRRNPMFILKRPP